MRVFIAIDVPKEISDKLKTLQSEFKDLAKIKFVNDFHCTLKFLGEISENTLNKVEERLNKIKMRPFEVTLTNIGVFPNIKRINVIWIGLKGKVDELQKKIDGLLLDIFPKDERFHSHITLGRVKFVKRKDELLEKLNLDVDGKFKVSEFKLIKSELTKDGATYKDLEVYVLEQ